jgi:hypothetical protein
MAHGVAVSEVPRSTRIDPLGFDDLEWIEDRSSLVRAVLHGHLVLDDPCGATAR